MTLTFIVLAVVFGFMLCSATVVVFASMLSSRITHLDEYPEQSLSYYDQADIEFTGELGKETA